MRRADVGTLAPDAELGNEGSIPFNVLRTQVVEQPTAAPDHHHEPAPRVMVATVHFEVFREVSDTPGEQRNLHLR